MIAKIDYHGKELTLAITYNALMEVTEGKTNSKMTSAQELEQLKQMFYVCLRDGHTHDSIFNRELGEFPYDRKQSDLIWGETAEKFQDLFSEAFPKILEEAKKRTAKAKVKQ